MPGAPTAKTSGTRTGILVTSAKLSCSSRNPALTSLLAADAGPSVLDEPGQFGQPVEPGPARLARPDPDQPLLFADRVGAHGGPQRDAALGGHAQAPPVRAVDESAQAAAQLVTVEMARAQRIGAVHAAVVQRHGLPGDGAEHHQGHAGDPVGEQGAAHGFAGGQRVPAVGGRDGGTGSGPGG